MLTNHIAYKYETSYNGPFNDNTLFNNVTVNLQYNMTEIRYIIRRIQPDKCDTKVEYCNSINMSNAGNILTPVI